MNWLLGISLGLAIFAVALALDARQASREAQRLARSAELKAWMDNEPPEGDDEALGDAPNVPSEGLRRSDGDYCYRSRGTA